MSFFGVQANVDDSSQAQEFDYNAENNALDDASDQYNNATFGGTPVGQDFNFSHPGAAPPGAVYGAHQQFPGGPYGNIQQGGPAMAPYPGLWQNPADGHTQPQQVSVPELQSMMQSLPPPSMGGPHMGMGGVPGIQHPAMAPGYYPPPWGYAHPMVPQYMPAPGQIPGYLQPQPQSQSQEYNYSDTHEQQQASQAHAQVSLQGRGPTQFKGDTPSQFHAPQLQPQPQLPSHSQPQPQPKSPSQRPSDDTRSRPQPKAERPKEHPTESQPRQKAAVTKSGENVAQVASETGPYSLKKTTATVRTIADARSALLAQAVSDREKQHVRDRKRQVNYSRYNGMMGDWDKNFIMRIQLQQLVSQDPYNEDFYYQVFNSLQDKPAVHQPLNEFAKMYLRGQGQRQKPTRRNERQALLQQVKDVVEKVRNRTPKDRVLHEGALGQTSRGTAVRPRKALALLTEDLDTKKTTSNVYEESEVSHFIEQAFDAILELEAHERARPPPDHESAAAWAEEIPVLQENLYVSLRVLDPVDPYKHQPFVMMLNHNKGKKLVPRAFPHLDHTRRLTVLTRLASAVDQLDVVQGGVHIDGAALPPLTAQAVEIFCEYMLPPIVHLVSEVEIGIVLGFMDILMSAEDLGRLVKTKVGQTLLTVLISRGEVIMQEQESATADSEGWKSSFAKLFDGVKQYLDKVFPPAGEDNSYVWHFLASLALAADLNMQRELVDVVRDRIFGAISDAKASPEEVGLAKLNNLNMFLNVMGLNATFDDISELAN